MEKTMEQLIAESKPLSLNETHVDNAELECGKGDDNDEG